MKTKITWLFILAFLCVTQLFAQQDRFSELERKLNTESEAVSGLNEKVDISITNTSIDDFLRGLASTHHLNMNIDPDLKQKVSVFLSDEVVKNVLIYMARQYDLDFLFTGSIITVKNYKNPLNELPPPPKELKIGYNGIDHTLTMDLQNDSLLSVTKKITQLSSINILVGSELFSKKLNGYIQNLPVVNALEKMALVNKLKIHQTNDQVIVLEPLENNEQIVNRFNNVPDANFIVKNTGTSYLNNILVSKDKRGHPTISINVVNSPTKDVIREIAEQAGINYFLYSELNGNTTANCRNLSLDSTLDLIFQNSDYTYSKEGTVYAVGKRQDEGLRKHKMITLKYRSVDSLLSIIPTDLKKGVDIREFKELNSFLLSGSLPQINEIENFVNEIDKTVPMVTIEVIMMDVHKSKTIATGLKLGVDTSGGRSVKTGGSLFGSGTDFTFSSGDINRFIDAVGLNNVFNIGRVTPSFYASLKLLEDNNNVELRQTPKLSTLNGHVANLSIGNKRYYRVQTQNLFGSLDPKLITTEEYKEVEANLSISIKPFVSGDEHVTLNINVDISDFTGASSLNQPPPTSSSKFQSIIRVKNEEMVVLGGIERNEKSSDASGTPILSHIPLIKWLFSNRTKTDSKTISIVFIKPSIIY